MRRRHADCNCQAQLPFFFCTNALSVEKIFMKIFPATLLDGRRRPFLELQTIANLCAFCMIFHLSFYFSFGPARVFPISLSHFLSHVHPWLEVCFVLRYQKLALEFTYIYSYVAAARKFVKSG